VLGVNQCITVVWRRLSREARADGVIAPLAVMSDEDWELVKKKGERLQKECESMTAAAWHKQNSINAISTGQLAPGELGPTRTRVVGDGSGVGSAGVGGGTTAAHAQHSMLAFRFRVVPQQRCGCSRGCLAQTIAAAAVAGEQEERAQPVVTGEGAGGARPPRLLIARARRGGGRWCAEQRSRCRARGRSTMWTQPSTPSSSTVPMSR
jgi:hypothetical protein